MKTFEKKLKNLIFSILLKLAVDGPFGSYSEASGGRLASLAYPPPTARCARPQPQREIIKKSIKYFRKKKNLMKKKKLEKFEEKKNWEKNLKKKKIVKKCFFFSIFQNFSHGNLSYD